MNTLSNADKAKKYKVQKRRDVIVSSWKYCSSNPLNKYGCLLAKESHVCIGYVVTIATLMNRLATYPR
jgi:hypothetical protein